MKITLLAVGSTGDVFPMLCLSFRLKDLGYDITVATHGRFKHFLEGKNIKFHNIRVDPSTILKTIKGQSALNRSKNPFTAVKTFGSAASPFIDSIGIDCFEACKGADAIVYSTLSMIYAISINEVLKLPIAAVFVYPRNPTHEFPCPTFTDCYLPCVPNRSTYYLRSIISLLATKKAFDAWRHSCLKLPPLSWNYLKKWNNNQTLTLYAFSKYVIAKPRDWGKHLKIVGYFDMAPLINYFENKSTIQKIHEFTKDGEKPVYIGFGSMINNDPGRITKIILDSLEELNLRAILSVGWGGLSDIDLPGNILKVDDVSNELLFPLARGIIHHGGAGTTGSALRYGLPSVIIPFFLDQGFWSQRVSALGAGITPSFSKNLTKQGFISSVRQLISDIKLRENAIRISKYIQSERDGAVRAANEISAMLEKRGCVS